MLGTLTAGTRADRLGHVLSPFRYFDTGYILGYGAYEPAYLALGAAVTAKLMAAVVNVIVLNRRDGAGNLGRGGDHHSEQPGEFSQRSVAVSICGCGPCTGGAGVLGRWPCWAACCWRGRLSPGPTPVIGGGTHGSEPP